MDLLFPLAVACEVFKFLDYETLVVVTRATQSVRRSYEPPALLFVKNLVRVAAGRVGSLCVRLHETSLTHNLWKLWRRSVGKWLLLNVPFGMPEGYQMLTLCFLKRPGFLRPSKIRVLGRNIKGLFMSFVVSSIKRFRLLQVFSKLICFHASDDFHHRAWVLDRIHTAFC